MVSSNERFCFKNAELTTVVRLAKQNFFEANPRYRYFENEIGSYVASALQQRNEKGCLRSENYHDDQVAKYNYYLELLVVAAKEMRKCKTRFRSRLPKLHKKKKASKSRADHGRYIDDYDFLPVYLS